MAAFGDAIYKRASNALWDAYDVKPYTKNQNDIAYAARDDRNSSSLEPFWRIQEGIYDRARPFDRDFWINEQLTPLRPVKTFEKKFGWSPAEEAMRQTPAELQDYYSLNKLAQRAVDSFGGLQNFADHYLGKNKKK